MSVGAEHNRGQEAPRREGEVKTTVRVERLPHSEDHPHENREEMGAHDVGARKSGDSIGDEGFKRVRKFGSPGDWCGEAMMLCMDVFVQPRNAMERSVGPIEERIVDNHKYDELRGELHERRQGGMDWHRERLRKWPHREIRRQWGRNEVISKHLDNNLLHKSLRRSGVVLNLPLVQESAWEIVQGQRHKIVRQGQSTMSNAEDESEEQAIAIWPSIKGGVPEALHGEEVKSQLRRSVDRSPKAAVNGPRTRASQRRKKKLVC